MHLATFRVASVGYLT